MDKEQNNYHMIMTYDEYCHQMDVFEEYDKKCYFPTEADIELMEKSVSKEVVLFACYLEDNLKPETAEQKYSVKALREFIEKHLELTE